MSHEKKKRYILLISIILAFFFSAIVGLRAQKRQSKEKGEQGNQGTIKQMLTFTQENNGEEYFLRRGEPIRLILPENPTTGYQWVVTHSTSPNIVLIRQEYFPQEEEPKVGSGGFRNMIFETRERGRAKLEIHLRRPWEPEEEYADSFTLNFEVY